MKDELIIFLILPAIILFMSLIMGASFYNTFLIIVPIVTGFFLYTVVRWAFFDKTNGLGKTAYGMWRKSYND